MWPADVDLYFSHENSQRNSVLCVISTFFTNKSQTHVSMRRKRESSYLLSLLPRIAFYKRKFLHVDLSAL